jgi:excisionase family DNA binding protein
MTLQASDRPMSLTDVSEMLGIPVHTLDRWRSKGGGPVGYGVGRHVRTRREAVEAWLEQLVKLPRLDSNQQPFGLSKGLCPW